MGIIEVLVLGEVWALRVAEVRVVLDGFSLGLRGILPLVPGVPLRLDMMF